MAPALDDSLKKLGMDYLDLYLMHWPVAFKKISSPDGSPIVDFQLTEDPYPTWHAMEKLVDSGKVRNIGVSKRVFLQIFVNIAVTSLTASISDGLCCLY